MWSIYQFIASAFIQFKSFKNMLWKKITGDVKLIVF